MVGIINLWVLSFQEVFVVSVKRLCNFSCVQVESPEYIQSILIEMLNCQMTK